MYNLFGLIALKRFAYFGTDGVDRATLFYFVPKWANHINNVFSGGVSADLFFHIVSFYVAFNGVDFFLRQGEKV